MPEDVAPRIRTNPTSNECGVWQAVEEEDTALHPGLVFYAFHEAGDATHDNHLARMKKLQPGTLAARLIARRDDEIQALRRSGYEVRSWRQTLTTRLAAGLGIESPTENGFTMDHTHGLPILLGSMLKGICQDQMIEGHYGVDMELPEARWCAKNRTEFVAIFGLQTPLGDEMRLGPIWSEQAVRGHVVFLDALPVLSSGDEPFDVDIINPHYQKYYSEKGKKPPADYYKPNPIKFLTVRQGITFRFTIAARAANFQLTTCRESLEVDVTCTAPCLADLTRAVLQAALQERGIGGKTRVGYGYFDQSVNE